ncbi:YolD-like family protein [Sporosarcina sp. A2]|uniref:YolD-like family protein n=1 Tax=Sporosarcina sp. A2 TaxID=3393449 RepID=UPI003D7B3688
MLKRNRDRGRIKWTAMMLPEHIARLREWQAEDNYLKRPDLTDWDIEDIQEQLSVAIRRKCQTLVRTWREGKITNYHGTIEEIDIHNQIIELQDPFEKERISAADIIFVQHID